jgi:CelD/BcsL family acetyltransferase involved in cellulose biosynthesis
MQDIEVIGSLSGLERLKPQWSELYRRCPRATPFQSPQWLIPWTRHLFRGGEILALAMRDDGELTGFAPLFSWGTQRRTISFLGAGISDYGDILFAPGREHDCATAVWNFLAEHRDDWDALDLQEVRSGSALLDGRRREECSVCPLLDLSIFPETMDHKHRTDLRRARNRVAKSAESVFTCGIEEFFQLYEARWGAMEYSIRHFHCDAASEFAASGDLRVALLHIDNRPAAAIYAFTAGRTIYCYLSGFDPAMVKLSPGTVLLGWLIEQAIAEGLTEIDFLRHPESYKYLWGARDRINYKISQASGSAG